MDWMDSITEWDWMDSITEWHEVLPEGNPDEDYPHTTREWISEETLPWQDLCGPDISTMTRGDFDRL